MIDKKNIHILGLDTHIPDSAFLTTEELDRKVGSNNGNLVYHHAISQILDLKPFGIPWHAFSEEKYPDIKVLILPLANQLGKHIDLSELIDIFSRIKIPIVSVGLGYQCQNNDLDITEVPEGTWKWFDKLINHAPNNNPNISLRGNKTYNFISKTGKQNHCIVTGCPSNFISPEINLGKLISKKIIPDNPRFAIAAGNPLFLKFIKIERQLIELLNSSNGIYIIQSPPPLIKLSREGIDALPVKDKILIRTWLGWFVSDAEISKWFREKSHVFYSVPEWMETLKRFDIVVGMRIHGVLLGIQTGIPSLCICVDSRTLELCQIMKIPHIDANDYWKGITKEEIITILKNWDWQEYDRTRKHLARILMDFFHKNEIPTADYFKKLCN